MTNDTRTPDVNRVRIDRAPVRRQPREVWGLPIGLVVVIIVSALVLVCGGTILTVAGLEAWTFFHRQNGLTP